VTGKTTRDLSPLVTISDLVLQSRLAAVNRAAAACAACRARLEDLARPAVDSDLPLAARALAEMRYLQWADARRAEVNMQLARHTAELMTARAEAAAALGRVDVLGQLAERNRPRRG
jgi:hypothetical protein